MKVFYCDHFVLPLPAEHRFPMEKYRLLRDRIAGQLEPLVALHEAPAAGDDALLLAHDRSYLEAVKSGSLDSRHVRALGFPWSPELVERSRRSVGATMAACACALEQGAAANLAGGTHHAFRERPEGFCVFNDSAVAARWLRRRGMIERLVIVDTDVHQGNGTAAILDGDEWAFTLSIHCDHNFPFRKVAGDLDVGLPAGTGDDRYLEALDRAVPTALRRARPDLVVYLAGSDAYQDDRFGKLALTKQGLARRDQLVFEHAGRHGLPVAVSMAGGYARHIQDSVDIHFESVRQAARYHRDRWGPTPRLSTG